MRPHTQILALLLVAMATACAETHARDDDAGTDAGRPAVSPDRFVDGFSIYVAAHEEPAAYGLGLEPALAIDRDGVFHITHVQQDDGRVLHTLGRLGDFRTEVVGRSGLGPFDIAGATQALAEDGTVHVAYSHDVELGVVHAQRALDGTWSRRALPLGPGPLDSSHTAVALLDDGTPLIVGTGDPIDDSWVEVVASVGDGAPTLLGEGNFWAGFDVQVVAGHDGVAYAAWEYAVHQVLATRDPRGAWSSRRIESVPAAAMAVGPDGALHLALTRRVEGPVTRLFHVVGDGPEVLIAEGWIQGVAIAVAASGAVHIAYETSGRVFYATDQGGAWTTESVELVSSGNGRPVIALDPSGRPWLAYRDADSALVLATPRAGTE